MYTLELGLWERIRLNMCLPRNALLSEMEQLLRIMNFIALTDEEKDSIEFDKTRIQTQAGDVIDMLNWNAKKLSEQDRGLTEIKFPAADFARLKKCADAWTKWPLDERSLALKAKMEAVQED